MAGGSKPSNTLSSALLSADVEVEGSVVARSLGVTGTAGLTGLKNEEMEDCLAILLFSS